MMLWAKQYTSDQSKMWYHSQLAGLEVRRVGFPLTQDVRSHVALSPVDFINKIWFPTKRVKGKYFLPTKYF